MKQFNKTFISFVGAMALFLLGSSFSAIATVFPFHNTYSGAQEVPPNASTARGTIVGTYDDQTNTISYTIIFSGLSAATTAAHFHGPAPMGAGAGVVIAHAGFPAGVTSGTYSATNVLTETQEAQLMGGLWYSNIHTVGPLAGGEIRAQILLGNPAMISPFRNTYSGAQEAPPNASTATGTIIGSYNHATRAISYSIIFSGLSAPTTAAHFHAPAPLNVSAGVVIAHAGFPVGVMAGFYSATNVLTPLQETQLLSGLWYSNIHTVGPLAGGEIRAQIQLTDILPPVMTDPSANPSLLWPPNHKMRNAAVTYSTTDNFPGTVNCVLSVTSNEPVTSVEDNTSPDWIVMNNHAVQLRAERSGAGNGRIYTVTVSCTDAQGNTSSKWATVVVPHDHRDLITGRAPTGELQEGPSVEIFRNPTRNYFTFRIQSNSPEKINIRLLDLLGRTVDSRSNLPGNQLVRMGSNLPSGVYYLMINQASGLKQFKVVKLD